MINQDLKKRPRISQLSALPQLLVIIYLNQSDKKILILKFIKINQSLKFFEFDLRLDSPNFGSVAKIVIQLFMVTNFFFPLCPNNMTHNIT